jgi:hypothetical protein
LNRDTGRWWFRKEVKEILGGRAPAGEQVRVAFLPATDETRPAFDGEEVRTFVSQLPNGTLQRQRAEQFLSSEGVRP